MKRHDSLPKNFELLKKGHVSAFADIHAKYSKHIYWIGRGLIKDHFIVESLVQDTFLKLWVHRESIQEPKHIFNFLRFVMTRECNTFYSRPGNKFLRNMNSLEHFDNYQDYMPGYDPLNDTEGLQAQECEQKAFDRIKRVLPLLDPERSHLIDLCLKYGFRYKAIADVMGTSINETYHGVKMAIEEIKTIIDQGQVMQPHKGPPTVMKAPGSMTEQQALVLKLRCEKKHSFASIAIELNLSQKEVHSQFTAAYKLLRDKHSQRSA